MRITNDVDLPVKLIDAQRRGDLVVFAGAGVSMGAPSNLPSFDRLADEIAAGAVWRDLSIPLDRFLGQLEQDHGILVNQRTRQILDRPNSRPTALHRDLIALFGAGECVRVVTTNFDRHFTTVADELFPGAVPRYCAPALPLGRDPRGLIYLHGTLENPVHPLVLTDQDFGQAYITDGWATRFLVEMFAKYVVLFVGYSHNDTVMNYLARSLVPGSLRFALTADADDGMWRFLGIAPIRYPLRSGALDEHGALTDAVAEWVRQAGMGSLDHEQRIKSLVDIPPPLEPELIDYLEDSLRDPVRLRFLVRYAKHTSWLEWIETRGGFSTLLSGTEDVDETSRILGDWFVGNFVVEQHNAGLALVHRNGQRLSAPLWSAIARVLAFRNPRPAPHVLSAWIAVLLTSARAEQLPWDATVLLSRLQYPEDSFSAWLLLEYLTRPRLKLRRPFLPAGQDGVEMDGEIVLAGDDYWLRVAWDKYFKPNLAELAPSLLYLLTSNLSLAQKLLWSIGRELPPWDSLGRSAIEPHSQDRHGGGTDFLITATRDVVEAVVSTDEARGRGLIEEWSLAESFLFRRLALFGVTRSPFISADQAISWLLRRDWLFKFGLKHEIFQLLKRAYPEASEKQRRTFLDRVLQGDGDPPDDSESRHIWEYEIYNVLVWLVSVAPSCSHAADELGKYEQAHPDFAPRRHPDLDSWAEAGVWGPVSPVSSDELLTKPPADHLELLLTFTNDGIRDRSGLLGSLSSAVSQSFDWGLELAGVLVERSAWDAGIWSAILSGWEGAVLLPQRWRVVVKMLTERCETHQFSRAIVRLLANGLKADPDEPGTFPTDQLESAESLTAHLLFEHDQPVPTPSETSDWTAAANSRLSGDVADLWMHMLSRRRAEAGDTWFGLPEFYVHQFERMLSSPESEISLGRVLLAAQVRFFLHLDEPWTVQNIVPLFDWTLDSERATQSWDGFLHGGRWDEAVLKHMMLFFEQSFSHLEAELSPLRERFCDYLAAIAVYSSSDPLGDGWLFRFLVQGGAQPRRLWAQRLRHILRELAPDVVQQVWNDWLRSYWAQRTAANPLPLDAGEATAMLEWAAVLVPVFDDLVDLVRATRTGPDENNRPVLFMLKKAGVARTHANALSQILPHLLSLVQGRLVDCSSVQELVMECLEHGGRRSDLLIACEELARLGCSAADLRPVIERAGATEN